MRMRIRFIAMATLLATVGATATAQLEKGTFAPDIEAAEWINTDEPISLVELRGMVVVVVFWSTWNRAGEVLVPELSVVNSREYRQRGLFLVGLTDVDKTKAEKLVKDKLIQFPVGVLSKSAKEYKLDQFSVATAVIDPYGKLVWSGGGIGDGEATRELQKIFEETPPFKTHPEEVIFTERRLAEARQYLREGNLQKAMDQAELAIEHTVFGDPLRARCQDFLDLIELIGRDRLTQAQAAIDDKDWRRAVGLLRDVRRDFLGLEVARSAKKRLDLLEKRYPEVKELLQQDSDSNNAEMKLATAIDALRSREFGDAYVQLEAIINEFPETPAAEKAKTVTERMRQNEGMFGYVKDHKASVECESLLAQARAAQANNRPSLARDLYRRILDEYGDTIYADEAVRRLQQLR